MLSCTVVVCEQHSKMVIEHVKQKFFVIISLLIELDDRIGNNN